MKSLSAWLVVLLGVPLWVGAEERSFDGSGNNVANPSYGAAGGGMARAGGIEPFYGDSSGEVLPDEARANARDISNAIFAQSESVKSVRGVSDLTWAWGQLVSHDIQLLKTDGGVEANGAAPIAVNDPNDPLAPGPIPFVRADWTDQVGDAYGTPRTPINYQSSYLDGSAVYGADASRAATLRDAGGKLLMGPDGLLPRNTAGLEVENNGPLPSTEMFLAGDIRANENPLLTSLHTVLAREHNRLVDEIALQRPGLDDEGRYQLARKLVGAEIQAITYNEYLPALVGEITLHPLRDEYTYSPNVDVTLNNLFAHAVLALEYTQMSGQLLTIDPTGAESSLALDGTLHNPSSIVDDPSLIDDLLRGAAIQRSEEIDTLMVDGLRNAPLGPPGSGGIDLAALTIQRGRDAGLPPFWVVSRLYPQSGHVNSFADVTSDQELIAALSAVYWPRGPSGMDAWVGGLAEDHVGGASLGRTFKEIIEREFDRIRDGDRFFYTGDDAGLYVDGVLDPEIAALVDLDTITLTGLIEANTGVAGLQDNAFFTPGFVDYNEGDLNGDGRVDAADYTVYRDQGLGPEALALFQAQYGAFLLFDSSDFAVPEPSTPVLLLTAVAATRRGRR